MNFENFIGQTHIKNILSDIFEYSKASKSAFPHTLFIAPPGRGKTMLALLLANNISQNVINVYAPTNQNWDTIQQLIARITPGAVLFIDEVHALPAVTQECLYNILTNFSYVEDGRTVKVPQFTVLACTTEPQHMLKPFYSRFNNVLIFNKYTKEELAEYIKECCLPNMVDAEVISQLITLSSNSPRKLNNILYQLECYVVANKLLHVSIEAYYAFLKHIGLTSSGLNALQVQYLELLESAKSMPLARISQLMELQPEVIKQNIEPDLFYAGYVTMTCSGRTFVKKNDAVVTNVAKEVAHGNTSIYNHS